MNNEKWTTKMLTFPSVGQYQAVVARCQDVRNGAQCCNESGHDPAKHFAVQCAEVIEWSTAPSVIPAEESCESPESGEVIGVRGVMTNAHTIDMSQEGIVLLGSARLVRIHPDKLFTPAPAVAEACREMLKEERQEVRSWGRTAEPLTVSMSTGVDVANGVEACSVDVGQQTEKGVTDGKDVDYLQHVGREAAHLAEARQAMDAVPPPDSAVSYFNQARCRYEGRLEANLQVVREAVHQRDIEITRQNEAIQRLSKQLEEERQTVKRLSIGAAQANAQCAFYKNQVEVCALLLELQMSSPRSNELTLIVKLDEANALLLKRTGEVSALRLEVCAENTRRKLAEAENGQWNKCQLVWQRRAEQAETELASLKLSTVPVITEMRAEAAARDIWANSLEARPSESSMAYHEAKLFRKWIAALGVQ